VRSLLERLEPRQRKILELRSAWMDTRAAAHVQGDREDRGLTRERVRQLEKQALDSLKELAERVA